MSDGEQGRRTQLSWAIDVQSGPVQSSPAQPSPASSQFTQGAAGHIHAVCEEGVDGGRGEEERGPVPEQDALQSTAASI